MKKRRRKTKPPLIKCVSCGEYIPADSYDCPICGIEIHVLKCSYCGNLVMSDYSECPVCGESLIEQKEKEQYSPNDFMHWLIWHDRKTVSTSKEYVYFAKRNNLFENETELQIKKRIKHLIDKLGTCAETSALKAFIRYLKYNELDDTLS